MKIQPRSIPFLLILAIACSIGAAYIIVTDKNEETSETSNNVPICNYLPATFVSHPYLLSINEKDYLDFEIVLDIQNLSEIQEYSISVSDNNSDNESIFKHTDLGENELSINGVNAPKQGQYAGSKDYFAGFIFSLPIDRIGQEVDISTVIFNVTLKNQCLLSAKSEISRTEILVISPPLTGVGWQSDGNSVHSHHRRSIMHDNEGHFIVPQRSALDISTSPTISNLGFFKWVTISTKYLFNSLDNSDAPHYGSEVVAVADGVVTSTKNNVEDNKLGEEPGMTAEDENVAGNYVIIDIGNGNYAQFAHLQEGSVTVQVGQTVEKGDVLGLLGNSGNSTGPHLHFQVGKSASDILATDGIPFVFDDFRSNGKSVTGSGPEFEQVVDFIQ